MNYLHQRSKTELIQSYLSSLSKKRMAEFVVSFALERLQNLASEEASLLHGVSFQVEQIRVEFKRMQCFLKDADARESESETIHNWVVEIKEIAYDVEDVLETYVLRVASRTSIQSFLKRCVCIFNEGKTLHKVGLEIQSIKTRISQLTTSLQTYGIRAITEGEGSSSSAYERQQRHVLRRSYSHVVEKDFVGLEEDVEKLVGVLVSEDTDSYHQTVSICGMGGLGKTTIAQKVYNDQNVKRHFDGFAWACVSQQWQTKDILQRILTKLVPHDMDRIVLMREEALVRMLLQVQQSRKCLIVIDDIWSEAAWDCIRPAFPIGDMGSKILITTRNKELALHVDPHGFLHEPRLLNEDESWGLLQKKACTKSDGTDNRDGKNLEELGRKMVRHCGGLPLAVVVLGGILATKQKLREWEMVHRNINSYIRKGKGMGQRHGVSQVLALSYSDLPYQLKSCFLYLGNFPEDCEIEADKLYQLWTAEGLVSLDDRAEAESMMDVAECYLGELAHRYMVQVEVDEFTGRFKSCSLHDLMRDLCLLKGKEQNFLTVIDFRHGSEKLVDSSYSSLDCKVRRLAVHLDEEDDRCVFPKGRTAQHLRSLSFFVPNIYIFMHMPKMMKSHLKDFKMLRVLDLSRILFSKKLAKAIGKLIHLRYLSLRNSGFRKLPSSIGNLGCLQTLDLRGHVFCVYGTIPNVLWKMKSLRHLYLNDPRRRKEKLRLDGLGKLEILETFTTHLFDVKDLFMLTNLRKLKAHVKVELEDLVAIINYLNSRANRLQHSSFHIEYNFRCEEEASLLRRLLECHRLNTLHLGGVIDELPEHHHFSPSLTMLEFSGSELKEDPMTTLEKLPNLRRLALGCNAFVGVEMVCSTLGFPQLKFLELQLSNLEDWMVNEGAMPNLSSLEITYCERLKMVPDGLRFISTLQELKISTKSEEFQRRLRVVDGEEGADLYKIRHVPSIIFFPVLSI